MSSARLLIRTATRWRRTRGGAEGFEAVPPFPFLVEVGSAVVQSSLAEAPPGPSAAQDFATLCQRARPWVRWSRVSLLMFLALAVIVWRGAAVVERCRSFVVVVGMGRMRAAGVLLLLVASALAFVVVSGAFLEAWVRAFVDAVDVLLDVHQSSYVELEAVEAVEVPLAEPREILCGVDCVDEVDVVGEQAGPRLAGSFSVLRYPLAEGDYDGGGNPVDDESERRDDGGSAKVDVVGFIDGLFRVRQVGIGVGMVEVVLEVEQIGLDYQLVGDFFQSSALRMLHRVDFDDEAIYRADVDEPRAAGLSAPRGSQ